MPRQEAPPPPAPAPALPVPGDPLARRGDEIVVCGQLFHTTTPVVLWMDPGGYDAYRLEPRFAVPREAGSEPNVEPAPAKSRFGKRPTDALPAEQAARVTERGWDLVELRKIVTQIVIHYDAVGNSRDCFRILHDLRGLSSHFLLDRDGTIYQTLDLKEMAWHAGKANPRSIGIEIANVGAYESLAELESLRERVPVESRERGPQRGRVRDREVWQYEFTPKQMDALAKLCATLCRVLPEIRYGTPQSLDGFSANAVLSEEERSRFRGILGHEHLQLEKIDPGPAFDWDWLLSKMSQGISRDLR